MCAEPSRQVGITKVTACQRKYLPKIQAILGECPEAAGWSARALSEALARNPTHFLVAWQGEEIEGFIAGRTVADEAEILNLAVKTQHRREGMGSLLVKALLEVFASERVFQVFLEVRESNAPAVAFYQGLGFRQVGRREGYYRQPDEAALVLAWTEPSSASDG